MYNSQNHNSNSAGSPHHHPPPAAPHPPPPPSYHASAYRFAHSPDHSPASPYNQPHQLHPPSSVYHRAAGPPPPPPPPAAATTSSAPSPHDKPASTFYDPTLEHRRTGSWGDQHLGQPRSSPDPNRPHYSYSPPVHQDRSPLNRPNLSPTAATARPHPASPFHTQPHDRFSAPTSHAVTSPPRSQQAMAPPHTTPSSAERPAPAAPTRVDPMSFSNILASADSAAPSSPRTPHRPLKASNGNHQQPEHKVDTHPHIPPPPPSTSSKLEPAHHAPPLMNGVNHSRDSPTSKLQPPSMEKIKIASRAESPKAAQSPVRVPNRPRIVINEKQYQTALARLESMDLSDIEDGNTEFQQDKLAYHKRRQKRALELEETEKEKRKRRRIAHTVKLANRFDRQAYLAKEKFARRHEEEATQQVLTEDAAHEKERKRVAQRNRRRELTKQRAEQEAALLKQQADAAESSTERERLIQNAEKAEKKAAAQTRLLNGEVPNKELRETSPVGPNLDGGVMSSFQMGDEASQETGKKKKGPAPGKRLKKSKEQKQAEKDNAAAAQAAIERGEDLVSIAPKHTKASKREREREREREQQALESTSLEHNPAAMKAYDLTYEAIWKDISQQIAKKVTKIKKDSGENKTANLRKTAVLASKEARRWQIKTNKSTKDTQARAKRVMREMLSFWKKNERDERDQRKLAEKLELDRARQAEKEREDNRQKRKLNFLISQTELYSHFIGKKVRTEEAERSTDDVTVSDQTIKPGDPQAKTIDLPDPAVSTKQKVTNFEDLDFDADDDAALHQAAMANAQNAVQEAQDRARAFNNNGEIQSQFDDGEMNFQNPTSLQSMDIPQPQMLACQLKEYQLKGLNWLVNLYEQGINGILADEMGLGKTVQSISVMAYLAEQHNIWGPFLVIAPASTLHNWQQEISRFVPGLKVLPYWGSAKDRKVLRKYWDRKHITYNKESSFHVLVTSYQLVVQDQQYFQKVRWQYMVLDEAQAIKSSQSSRWKSLLGFHCRNRLLLTGTPIQNSMQELWALLHFIMPSLFDSHDEFSEWFSKDIESHAQSNTKLNEDQLKRLHMILKPFMLRRIKKHVQKELGDKIEEDVFCDLTYRQRAYYTNLRNKISIMDLIEKAAVGDDQDTATLMNLVMQFRKVCNHPDLFERAETTSPMSFAYFAETASFLREGNFVDVGYSVRNHIDYRVPKMIARGNGRIDLPSSDNEAAGGRIQLLAYTMNIFTPDHMTRSSRQQGAFSWLNFVDQSAGDVARAAHKDVFQRAVDLRSRQSHAAFGAFDDQDEQIAGEPVSSILNIVDSRSKSMETKKLGGGVLESLMNISSQKFVEQGLNAIELCSRPAASAPPIEIHCSGQDIIREKRQTFFNTSMRQALFSVSEKTEQFLLDSNLDPKALPAIGMLPNPISEKALWTKIQVPSMRRFVTDSGKLARLDRLLGELKEGGHRVLLYFQMTRMIDLMEEYLTYRNYKYCRLDGSTKLEDRRDTVADFQNRDDIFVFLLSTRAGGLGINLTAADTVIFYDSDWNPTIDSQAMDRAHRLGQTKQVTVYRMITRGTIEERIRQRALQKEEVQRVVISGGAGAQVDFNTRSRENRTKDIAMWLADDDQAEQIEKREAELAEKEAKEPQTAKNRKKAAASAAAKKKVELSLDDMYHEGEGHFDDSNKPSGAATPVDVGKGTTGKRPPKSKKAKTVKEKLAFIDGNV